LGETRAKWKKSNLRCNALHHQAQAPDDPLHDRDSQYVSSDSLYPAPFCNQVPRIPTKHHFHFLQFQFLSKGNDHLLSGSGCRSHSLRVTIGLYPIFPSLFSVHPSQERPWANTGGSQGFSRSCWGYVHLLLIKGYVPGWIRFVRQFLVCVHSDVIVTCLSTWMYFYRGFCDDTVHTFLYGSFTKATHDE
jgi:hypothetical protein